MQINLCHYAKTKSFKVGFVVASGNNTQMIANPLLGSYESGGGF